MGTVRTKQSRLETEFDIEIPREIYKLSCFVTLTSDVMFVNGIPFLTTLSRNIRVFSVEFILYRTAVQLGRSLIKIVRIYTRGGFMVNVILMDQEFDKVESEVELMQINTTAAREHVGGIERGICLIKEHARGFISTCNFTVIPRQFVIHLLYFCVMWLNATPKPNGILDKFSPRELILRRRLGFNKHFRGDFGEYIQAHDYPDVTNDMKERTYDSLYLGPTGDIQGTFKAFDVKTGRVKNNRKFTRVPMPDSVVKLVNNWVKRSQKEHQKKKLEFLNRLQKKLTGTIMNMMIMKAW